MIPAFALKILPYVVGIGALAGAVLYIDHRGFERAEQQAEARENERKLQLAATAILINNQANVTREEMQRMVLDSDSRLYDVVRNLDTENKTIVQPTLVKEIRSDPRFSDPDAGITRGMLDALNTARGVGAPRPCPAGADSAAGC